MPEANRQSCLQTARLSMPITRRTSMTKYRIFVAAFGLAAAIYAAPAAAWEAIAEPGAYAFYHPNGDLGFGSPARPADAMASVGRGELRMSVKTHHVNRATAIRR
jgi:hypothetical protein